MKETKPRIVCLCGSTRFVKEFADAAARETVAGKIVLTVHVFKQLDGVEVAGQLKAELILLHLRKIDMADEVLVINPGGYIGDGTAAEIGYARAMGRTVYFLEGCDGHNGDGL